MTKQEILNKHLSACKYESDKVLSSETYNAIISAMDENTKAKLEEAVKEITKLHSESKKLERNSGSTGFVEFGKTNAYRNCINIITKTPID